MCNPSRISALCHCIPQHASCRVEGGGEYATLDEMVALVSVSTSCQGSGIGLVSSLCSLAIDLDSQGMLP